MWCSKKTSLSAHSIRFITVCALAAAHFGRAEGLLPESTGVRGGSSYGVSWTSVFMQVEAFADWNLPLRTESDSGWFLQTKLNLTVGGLSGNGVDAVTGTLGPALSFGKRRFPLSLEGGISPTLISAYRFGTIDFGRELQFTSYIGLNLELTEHWRLGYRFQHMSNAGMAASNPGLNMKMFALSYAF